MHVGALIAAGDHMSKNNNVNPGQYRVAGRERQGEAINQRLEKAELSKKAQQPGGRKAHRKDAKRNS